MSTSRATRDPVVPTALWARSALPLRALLLLTAACGDCGRGHGGQLQGQVGDGAGTDVDFGNVLVGQTSAPKPVIISNVGLAPLRILSASLSGPNAGDFQLTAPLPESIAAGDEGSTQAVLDASAAGPRAATLEVVTDGTPANVSIQLSGVGVDLSLCVTPTPLAFGAVQVGGTPASKKVAVSNCGQSPLSFSVQAITGSQAGDFSVTSGATSTPIPLAPGQALGVAVAYAPSAEGPGSGVLPFQTCDTSGDCAAGAVPLSGTGVDGVLVFAPNPITFANVPAGQSASSMVTGTNTGNEALTLTALGTRSGSQTVFAIAAAPILPAALAPGASIAFSVTYTASGTSGGDADQLVGTFTVSDPSVAARQATDPLSGDVADTPCSLTVDPPTLGFGGVAPGVAQTRAATITNLSPTDGCTISGVALSASTDPTFSLPSAQPLTFTIAAGATAALSVTADPPSGGVPTLRLGDVSFNANGFPAHATVPLSASVAGAYPCLPDVGQLDALAFELPCTYPGPVCLCGLDGGLSLTLNGTPGVTYAVTAQFFGSVETRTYYDDSGAAFPASAGLWVESDDGCPVSDLNNIYELSISNPPQTYYLNNGDHPEYALPVDYTLTFLVDGQATVTLLWDSIDGVELGNVGADGQPINFSQAGTQFQDYPGEWVQMTVLGVDGGNGECGAPGGG